MFNCAAQSDGKLFAHRDAVLRHLPLQSPFGPQRHRIPYWRTEHTKGDLTLAVRLRPSMHIGSVTVQGLHITINLETAVV